MSHCLPTLVLAAAAAGLAACSPESDAPVAPIADTALPAGLSDKAEVCHLPGGGAAILSVSADAVKAHMGHGDYLAGLEVDPGNPAVGDGRHFARVTDALAAARSVRLGRGELQSAACRITITAATGILEGTTGEPAEAGLEHFPLVVDVPDITLRGALVMRVDANGRATGEGLGGAATIFAPIEPLPIEDVGCTGGICGASTPILIADAHPGGSAGHRLVVEGFVFQSGHSGIDTDAGGQGVFTMRAEGVLIRGNRFEEGFTESIDLRAGSGVIERNHLGGGAGTCDICIAGPGVFRVADNRLLAGGIPGILSAPVILLPVPSSVEQLDLPATADITSDIINNEVRDHLRVPVGVGVRAAMIGRGAPDVPSTTHMRIHGNALINNNFAVILESGFPVRNTALRGDADIVLGGNLMQQSCQTNLLVAFTRHTTGLGLTNQPYVMNSTYAVALGGDLLWSEAWYSHPADLGNTLVVDGSTIANGTVAAYDPSKSCST